MDEASRRTTATATLIAIPVSIIDIRPRVDRSWRLAFETRELTGEEVKLLADNFQGEGQLVYKSNGNITPEEIPEGKAEPGTRSQSQRLRAVIMVLWKQQGSKGDPEAFYRTYMEKLIEYVKSKFED